MATLQQNAKECMPVKVKYFLKLEKQQQIKQINKNLILA